MMQQPDVPWPRVTYADAIEILKADAHLFEHPPAYEDGLHSEHEKYLARKLGATGHDGVYRPVFVTHYPRDIKAFYMRPSALAPATDGSPQPRPTVDCFDLIVPDLCEIAGGSMREHRLEELLDTMQRRGMVAPPVPGQRKRAGANGGDPAGLDWYLDLRRWGSCPHGGFGLGFDRLLSYLAGVQNVRDVVAFPRWFGRCDA
jgi:asparaginyl-tRNA synthetase